MTQPPSQPHALSLGPVEPGQQWRTFRGGQPWVTVGPEHFARLTSLTLWRATLDSRATRVIPNLSAEATVPGMQFDAFFELCRMYSAWAEASRAELVAEPWRGAYFKGRPVWKHHVKRDSEGHVINHKTFSATFFLPRQIAGVASFQSIDPEFGQDQFRRVPRTGDVIQILGPLVGTWIQQVGDLGKVRWKFRTGIYRPEGDQLPMGLTPVWLDHNPPDGDLSKLDYNRVPVLPAFANHEVSPPPAWP